MKFNLKFSYFDYKLLLSVILIVIIGFLALYSVSFYVPGFNNFKRQLLFLGLSLIIFIFVSRSNYGIWENYARILYVLGLGLMILVLFIGKETHGTAGWISFYSYHLQPVEVMKVGLVFLLARYLSRLRMDDKHTRHVILTGVYCLIPVLLTLLQPDWGSAMVLVGIWFVMLLVWGMKRRVLAVLLLAFVLLAGISWLFILKPYQKDRIMVLMNPEVDPAGSGYHVLQSMTAIGSGRLVGKGLGYGSQSQLHFLPEAHTDFIFAAIGEELGFIGIMLLLGGFGLLFFRMYQISRKSADNFGRFVVIGVMAFFFIQCLINIGMNLGLAPVTGLPLPLVSYGGSALAVEFFLLGVVFSVFTVSRKSESYR